MDRRVQTVIAFMGAHIQDELSLEQVAKSVNLSPSRLRHLFKGEVGISPAQYLKLLRMQRAKDLLNTTFLNVKQIMSIIGVQDKRHFTEDFKKNGACLEQQSRNRLFECPSD
jgi:transcriptional regulator GlxA family with amidase domain